MIFTPPETTRPLNRADVTRASAYARTHAGTLVARVASIEALRVLGGTATLTAALIGYVVYGWSGHWILLAYGIDFIALWLTDLLRITRIGRDWDLAATALLRHAHAVATARCVLEHPWLRPGILLTAPDPRHDWASHLRHDALVLPAPVYIAIMTALCWDFAPTERAPVGMAMALMFLPLVVRPLAFAIETYRRAHGAQLVDVALPSYPDALARLAVAVALFAFANVLAMKVPAGAGLAALLDRHGGLAAVLAGALATAVVAAFRIVKARHDVALLSRFHAKVRDPDRGVDDLANP